MIKHCCNEMEKAIEFDCEQHSDGYECPNTMISYIPKFDEYGIIIHDGGTASTGIAYCPWCGTKLPTSKRDLWFDTLEALGFDDPSEQDIPEKFLGSNWHRDT